MLLCCNMTCQEEMDLDHNGRRVEIADQGRDGIGAFSPGYSPRKPVDPLQTNSYREVFQF